VEECREVAGGFAVAGHLYANLGCRHAEIDHCGERRRFGRSEDGITAFRRVMRVRVASR